LNRVGKWPEIELMHGAIIDVGALDLAGKRSATEVFLFVADAAESLEQLCTKR